MENNNFGFNENIMLSKINGSDLKEFLRSLDGFYLVFRDNLGLASDLSFGTEIEYLGVKPLIVDFYVNEIMRDWNLDTEWESKREPSLYGGGEITSPIMDDDHKYWIQLKSICEFLKNNSASPLVSAAGHIHFGAKFLGSDINSWRKFIKLYTIFENILYRFGYGDKINGRLGISGFAKPVGDILLSKMWRFNYASDIAQIKDIYPNDTRGYGLNLRHVNFDNISKLEGNTIEFRFPNATTEEVIWQNNINVLGKLLIAARNSNLDEDYLDYLLHEKEQFLFMFNSSEERFLRYKNVCFRESLLFSDIIFDNILDKVYFLKQYLKGFQNTEEKDLVLARRFIK